LKKEEMGEERVERELKLRRGRGRKRVRDECIVWKVWMLIER
jgi:hypothetical protein